MQKEESLAESCTTLVILFLALPLMALFNGWIIIKYWNWFILPVFKNAPILTLPYAIGLSAFISMLTVHFDFKVGEDKTVLEQTITRALFSILCLSFGYFVHLFT